MPKAATGEIRWTHGVAIARVTLRGKDRASFELPTCADDARARERARLLADVARRLRLAQVDDARTRKALDMVAGASPRSLRNAIAVVQELVGGELRPPSLPDVPTFRKIGEDWTSGRLAQRYPDQIRVKRTVAEDVGRLTRYVYPILGGTPIDRVTLDQCEEVMRTVPATLAVPTRRNIGHMMVKVLRMAVYPLRLIERSPIPPGFLPGVTKRKAMAYLYPDEDRRLMACLDVPLEYRLLWGFLAREGMREGEALALTWADLDLERGAVRLDKNKTDDPRAWALSAGVAAALAAYGAAHKPAATPGDRVFTDPTGRWLVGPGLAMLLRSHLCAIGLDQERPELFTTTAERQRIRVHDLRGTFVTLSLAAGRSESWISDRTGHRSSMMITHYKRTARTFAELQAGTLAALVEAIPELSPEAIPEPLIARGLPTTLPNYAQHLVTPTRFEGERVEVQPRDITEMPQKAEAARRPSSPIVGPLGQSGGNPGPSADHVEVALADALTLASAAGEWTAVAQLARELEARRQARANVVDLDAERNKRGGGR